MDTFDTVMLQGNDVIERVAQDLFDIMPEEGVAIVFIDRQGNRWSSQPGEPFGGKGDESMIDDLIVRIDDGDEPTVANTGDVCVIASQLSWAHTHWGYVMVVLPKRNVDTSSLNLDLAEWILRQTNLLAQYYEED